MILAVNIGNLNISLGCFENNRLVASSNIFTEKFLTEDQYAVQFQSILNLYNVDIREIEGAIIGSVVPELTHIIKRAILKFAKVKVMVVGPGIKTGLNILIDNPAQLGADLVACSVAAINIYKKPCIIFYFEIATCACVIDESGNFIGSIISPGVDTSIDVLSKNSSLLFHVNIKTPNKVIGNNTIESLQSGIIYGTASMIDGLVERICGELNLKEKPTLIATGKRAKEITKNCFNDLEVHSNLVLEGLNIIYKRNMKS